MLRILLGRRIPLDGRGNRARIPYVQYRLGGGIPPYHFPTFLASARDAHPTRPLRVQEVSGEGYAFARNPKLPLRKGDRGDQEGKVGPCQGSEVEGAFFSSFAESRGNTKQRHLPFSS